jgi:hypothetical protein
MQCCLPFLYKPKALAEVRLPPLPSLPSLPPLPQPEPEKEAKKQVDEDPVDVPQVVRLRLPPELLRIPDALMDIRNPSIKAQFKEFCKNNNLCVACSYTSPNNPTVLVFNGVLYECPHCDSDVDSP